MITHEEYLRFKAMCEAFDADNPATYITPTPELQELLDEQAARCEAEWQARRAAKTPADYDRWDTVVETITVTSKPTPGQVALADMFNISIILNDIATKNGWDLISFLDE